MAKDESSFEPAEIARRLEALIGREDVSEDYIRFRVELLAAQTSVRDALVCSAPPDTVDANRGGRIPALDPGEAPFDRRLLGKLFEDVCAALTRRERRSEDLPRLSAAVANDPEFLEQLVVMAAFGPDEEGLAALSKRLGVASEALLFFGRMLSAPFVTEAVRRLKQRSPEQPKASGCCPWCGSPPGLAKLKREEGQEGRRVLFCSLCGESWEFARLECPFCGSQEALGVLSVEGAGPCSVETCGRCNGYLKTVDERKLPEDETIVPLVETTATVYLDLISEKEGCARSLPYGALR